MSPYPKLKNAPVAEAIIELRIGTPSPTGLERFDLFRDRLKDQFPKAQQIRFFETRLNLGHGAEVKNDVSHSVVGV